MIRAVNLSLEPEKVAEALVSHASEWIPAPAWLVLAVDGGGRTRSMAANGLTPPLETCAHAVGTWVMRSGEVFTSASVGQDRRVNDKAEVAATGSRWTAGGAPLARSSASIVSRRRRRRSSRRGR